MYSWNVSLMHGTCPCESGCEFRTDVSLFPTGKLIAFLVLVQVFPCCYANSRRFSNFAKLLISGVSNQMPLTRGNLVFEKSPQSSYLMMISCQLFTHLDILLVCECASTRVREPPLGLHAKLRTFLFFFLIVCLCLVNPRMMKYAKSQTQDSEMLFPEDQKRGPHRQQLLMKLSFLCASSDCFPGNQQEPGVPSL